MGLRDSLAARAARVRSQHGVVPSPCIEVCQMQGDLCRGCLRTLDEIAQWGRADEAQRRMVWARIEHRLAETTPSAP